MITSTDDQVGQAGGRISGVPWDADARIRSMSENSLGGRPVKC